MACDIQIDSVGRVGSGGSARVVVIGTVQECATDIEGSTVTVTLFCGRDQTRIGVRDADVQANGFWSAQFPGIEERCTCAGPVRVTAACATDDACATEFEGSLDCIDCPRVGSPGDDVNNPQVFVQCNADGTANVTVRAEFVNTTPNMAYAKFEAGTDATVISSPFTGFTPGASDIMEATFQYPTPHNPQPVLLVHYDNQANPVACAPYVMTIPPLEDCRDECPRVVSIDVRIGECERDPVDNIEKRRVTFTPTVVGPVPDAHVWDFGDGENALGVGAPQTVSHLYAGIPIFEPSLCLTGPGTCEQSCRDVPLNDFAGFEACACPTMNGVNIVIGECVADPNGGGQKREVTFTPIISGPPPTSHVWDFGDGTNDVSVGAPGVKVHLYDEKPTSPPELCISGPEPCEDRCLAVPMSQFDNFEACGGGSGGGGGGGGDESFGCGVMRIGIAILMALAILAGLLALCVPPAAPALAWIAGISAVAGLILGIIYAIFCPNKPCKIGLLLSGQATLAAGVVAIVLSACCAWLVWSGLALIASGIGLLFLWKSLCNKTNCDVAKQAVVVIGGLVLPVLGVLTGIPIIGATCFTATGLAWVSAVFGPVSAYAATC